MNQLGTVSDKSKHTPWKSFIKTREASLSIGTRSAQNRDNLRLLTPLRCMNKRTPSTDIEWRMYGFSCQIQQVKALADQSVRTCRSLHQFFKNVYLHPLFRWLTSMPLEYLHYASVQSGDRRILLKESGIFSIDSEERKYRERWHFDSTSGLINRVSLAPPAERGIIKLLQTNVTL